MTAVLTERETIVAALNAVSQSRSTGELIFHEGGASGQEPRHWRFYFFYGRLIYATGDWHRGRRWTRSLNRHCPNVQLDYSPQEELWEYQLLSQAVATDKISLAQVREMIKSSLEEVLFFLLTGDWAGDRAGDRALHSEWRVVPRFALQENFGLSLLLSWPQLELALHQVQRLCHQWRALDLEGLHPYLSPRLGTGQFEPGRSAMATAPMPKSLARFLTGRHTLWDLSVYTRCSVPTLTRFLLPWLQCGAIGLEPIPDLMPTATATPVAPPPKPLIACVDDSPTVGRVLETILVPAGYRLISIHDSLSGIATLAKHKPDLILLDLIMPDTSGYNLCSFLRRTQVFQNTPIIVLTSQDGLVDRTRAKLAGASDFMTKPPDPKAMLNLIHQHLQMAIGGNPQLA